MNESDQMRLQVRKNWIVPAVLALLFTVLVGLVASRHEMWRDEMQPWLLARDSATPLALLHNIRYEIHPGLWYLLLWPLAQLSANPVWMQALHVLIAGGSAFLLFRFSPFSWPVKVLMILGYYFTYEWAGIARNYALTVLLLFGFCALFAERWRRFPLLGLLLLLLCHTNIHALLIVGVLVGWLSVEFTAAFVKRRDEARRYLGRFLGGLAIAVLGMVTGILQTKPPADAWFSPKWRFTPTANAITAAAGTIANAYLPVPPERLVFWNTNRFALPPAKGSRGFWIPPEACRLFAVAVLLIGSLFFLKRPWVIVPYLAGSGALLLFFSLEYIGFWRHHGMLWLLFVALLWLSFHYRPWTARSSRVERLTSFWDRHRMKALLPLLAIHVWGAWVAVKVDWTEPFTQATAAADWLTKRFPDRSGVFFVGYGSEKAVPVVAAMELDRCYYPDRDAFGSYILSDHRRMEKVYDVFLQRVARVAAREGKDAVLVLSLRLPEIGWKMGVTDLHHLEGATVIEEQYHLYYWPREQALPWAAGPGATAKSGDQDL